MGEVPLYCKAIGEVKDTLVSLNCSNYSLLLLYSRYRPEKVLEP